MPYREKEGTRVKGAQEFVPDIGSFPDAKSFVAQHRSYLGSDQHLQDTLDDVAAKLTAVPSGSTRLEIRVHNKIDGRVFDYLTGAEPAYKEGSFEHRLSFNVQRKPKSQGRVPPGMEQDGQFVEMTILL